MLVWNKNKACIKEKNKSIWGNQTVRYLRRKEGIQFTKLVWLGVYKKTWYRRMRSVLFII